MSKARITLFYAPGSRAVAALALCEELEVEYDLHVLDLSRDTQRAPEYVAVNPMGKVPAILHEGVLVSEQPAVLMHLADLHPQAALAPAVGTPARGAYLRWMVFYGSCFEPALMDRALQREPGRRRSSPYGSWEDMYGTLVAQLERGPWILGNTFSAADVLWGMALNWTTGFKLVPDHPVIRTYVDRVLARPALQRALARDAGYAASLA